MNNEKENQKRRQRDGNGIEKIDFIRQQGTDIQKNEGEDDFQKEKCFGIFEIIFQMRIIEFPFEFSHFVASQNKINDDHSVHRSPSVFTDIANIENPVGNINLNEFVE